MKSNRLVEYVTNRFLRTFGMAGRNSYHNPIECLVMGHLSGKRADSELA